MALAHCCDFQRLGLLQVVLILTLAASLCVTSAYPANFFCTLGDERMKLDIDDYDLPDTASYIVGVKEKSSKAGVLEDLVGQFDWRPQYEYSTMSMFSGFLSPEQVTWLLSDERIAYVECDGFVKVAKKQLSQQEAADKELRR